jgi:hypothetical protein
VSPACASASIMQSKCELPEAEQFGRRFSAVRSIRSSSPRTMLSTNGCPTIGLLSTLLGPDTSVRSVDSTKAANFPTYVLTSHQPLY